MKENQRPLIISIEGGEGAGKSSVIETISRFLNEKQIKHIVTREPGGVRISEKIRDIILNKEHLEMDAKTEALLFAAARRQHLIEKVLPAVQAGKCVVFDRFVDSSLVYQGYVRGLGIEAVRGINAFAIEGFYPDLTLFLDVTPEVGLDRINQNPDREVNKLDLEGIQFHLKVREGYYEIMKQYPERIVRIDADKSLEDVLLAVIKEIEQRL